MFFMSFYLNPMKKKEKKPTIEVRMFFRQMLTSTSDMLLLFWYELALLLGSSFANSVIATLALLSPSLCQTVGRPSASKLPWGAHLPPRVDWLPLQMGRSCGGRGHNGHINHYQESKWRRLEGGEDSPGTLGWFSCGCLIEAKRNLQTGNKQWHGLTFWDYKKNKNPSFSHYLTMICVCVCVF